MQENNNWNTDLLWSTLLSMISAIVLLSITVIVYFGFRNDIDKFFNRPKYDKLELAKRTTERASIQIDEWDRVEKGIHVKTGMVYDKNFKFIKANCLSCHSSKMITQNRATRQGWHQMIRWMQKTQGLHDLGDSEVNILDYLSTHYAPKDTGRRPNLDIDAIEWYVLDLN